MLMTALFLVDFLNAHANKPLTPEWESLSLSAIGIVTELETKRKSPICAYVIIPMQPTRLLGVQAFTWASLVSGGLVCVVPDSHKGGVRKSRLCI